MTTNQNTPLDFNQDLEVDSTHFARNSSNPSEVEVKANGDYLFFHSVYNARSSTANGNRESPFLSWLLNGTRLDYGNS